MFDEELTDLFPGPPWGVFSWPTSLFLALENPGTLRLAEVEKPADGPSKLIQNPLVEPTSYFIFTANDGSFSWPIKGVINLSSRKYIGEIPPSQNHFKLNRNMSRKAEA